MSPKGGFVFSRKASVGQLMTVPCGQCIGCRLERSRQWVIRIMHESSLHELSSFITLTYRPSKLPAYGTLVPWHFNKFIKRLRSRLHPHPIKYFHCGEYGEKFSRPHYHAIIFGFNFFDKVLYQEVNDQRYYQSQFLDDVWTHGKCIVGDVSFESAGYVARYCVKKVNGDRAYDHYWRPDPVTGEAHLVEPEYATMSNGLGAGWFEKFGSDVFPRDEVVMRGCVSKPPRFYDLLYEKKDPSSFERVKRDRILAARKNAADCTPDRLATREIVQEAQVSFLHRSYENGS